MIYDFYTKYSPLRGKMGFDTIVSTIATGNIYFALKQTGVRLSRQLSRVPSSVTIGERYPCPGAELFDSSLDPICGHLNNETEEFFLCLARHWSFTLYHPVGTCSMGKVGI